MGLGERHTTAMLVTRSSDSSISIYYDVASGSEIMACNKFDKTIVVYQSSGKGAYIMTKL